MKTRLQLINTFICFLIVSGPMTLSAQCWQQVGQELEGEEEYDFAGASIGLSEDGNTIVYGAEQNNFNRGKTKVFKWNGTTWIQKGSSIIGETMGERSGTSVSISNDGSILAIGANANDQVIQNAGVVRVFEWANNDWVQKGNSIYGLSLGELIGEAINLSDDGNTLAIGASFKLFEDGTNSTLGLVRVYHWEDSNWVQIGTDLTGQSEGDWFGSSVSLNGDGNYLAVGAKFSSLNGQESGYVKVYQWNTTEWVQVGDDFMGENGETLGASIALTSDAQSVVIGAPLNSDNGTLKGKLYVFDRVNGNWIQRGNALVGESMITRFGESVSISTDGTIIAAGGIQNGGNGQNSGHVRAYYWNGNAWGQIGEDIDGETSQDFFGSSVALSGTGSILAASAPSNDGPATNTGQIRVFQSCEFLSLSEQETTNFSVFPNPSSEFITIDFGKQLSSGKISLKNALGQIIDEQFISKQSMVHFSLPLQAGSYFLTITTPEFGAVTQKVVKL